MNKPTHLLTLFFVLALAAMACVSPLAGVPTSSPDQVGTVVALTLQALTPSSDGEVTPEPADLLPHSLYYLGTDSAGLTQVFRIDRNGGTPRQVTSETTDVGNYDVSPVDGSVAYVVNNQLVLIDADGSGRRVLVDAGPVDENNAFLSNISSPVFAPNGQTLAYGHKGLNFYALATGVTNRVLEDQIDDMNGMAFPRELYWPDLYSPDGSKLLITLGYYEGASAAIYYPDSKSLVRLQGAEGALICCGNEQWTSDSSSFYAANPNFGMYLPGLWRVDAATGQVSTLVPGEAGGTTYNVSDEPYLAPDGQLHYFFATVSAPDGFAMRAPVKPVRSQPDGVTGRTIILDRELNRMNEALWAPDASLAVVAYAPVEEVYEGGQAEILYLDGRPGVVLTSFARQMKWGP